ncbi:hypothetical protein OAO01_03930 [Oligoflexia bacterium]|nr:hypothetical protein [Oligoflexia bacterium]
MCAQETPLEPQGGRNLPARIYTVEDIPALRDIFRWRNLTLIDEFLSPLQRFEPDGERPLVRSITPELLEDPHLLGKIQEAERILGSFAAVQLHTAQVDPEMEQLDQELMRKCFFYHLLGSLRELKFNTESQLGTLRPELEMMRRLIEEQHSGQGEHFIANWCRGTNLQHATPPYTLQREDRSALGTRFNSSLTDAIHALSDDSVLGRLCRHTRIQEPVTAIIVETDDQAKEKELSQLRRLLTQNPTEYLERHLLRQINASPAVLINQLFVNRKYLLPKVAARIKKSPKFGHDLRARILGQTDALSTVTRYLDTESDGDDLGEVMPREKRERTIARLKDYLNPSVVKKMEEDRNYLAASLVADLVVERVRTLNHAYRAIVSLQVEVKKLAEQRDMASIKKGLLRIVNLEGSTGDRTEKRAGTAKIARSEFTYFLQGVVDKINRIGKVGRDQVHLERFIDMYSGTSGNLVDLLEGLRVENRCLSYDSHWGESQHTIPELLFSATADTLLLFSRAGKVDASLTVRLMPIVVEGKLEPVLFRQKVRIRADNDIHRVVLNNDVIYLAAVTGVTKIVGFSGFIGDEYAPGYNPDHFNAGFLVRFPGSDGSEVFERVKLSKKRFITDYEVLFVAPEICDDEGFHAHDNKYLFPQDEREIYGMSRRVFSYPEQRSFGMAHSKPFRPQLRVVDIVERERLTFDEAQQIAAIDLNSLEAVGLIPIIQPKI